MGIWKYLVSLSCLSACALLLVLRGAPHGASVSRAWLGQPSGRTEIAGQPPGRFSKARNSQIHAPLANSASLSVPLTLEQNIGQADAGVAFIARGKGITALLTRKGIELLVGANEGKRTVRRVKLELDLSGDGHHSRATQNGIFQWQGSQRVRSESNYFLGNEPRRWRTHVPHFASAAASEVVPGVGMVLYGNENQIEYDLRVSPRADARRLRLAVSGADDVRLDSDGNLLLTVAANEITMRKPTMYAVKGPDTVHQTLPGISSPADLPERGRVKVDGGYILRRDETIAFRVAPIDPHATLILDPSISLTYSTFLGGAGEDSANSVALDSTGKLYIGGTTTSAATFSAGNSKIGPSGSTDFFVAKIDPTAAGANSLIYLTFLGGSGDESGGLVAVDSAGNLAITGTTTSTDFPVTDASKRTSGPNDTVVAEIAPSGSSLVFSTLFGGNGSASTQGAGGIAFDKSANIFVAADTTSTDLPTTPNALHAAYGGGASDGFLAEFGLGPALHLKYCSYLGINAQVGVGGVAVDAGGNAYVTGFTSNPGSSFSTFNGFQTTYGGDPYDAFLMKIRPSGTGSSDLAYGTFLGGAGLDEALAVTVGTPMPATAYVTGTTQSQNFPMNGTRSGPQTTLKGTANAFFAAIAQDATTGITSLAYSAYLGGSQSDAGTSAAFAAPNSVYIAGKMTSFDYLWLNNLQPFSGASDAFFAKFDPTSAGSASLLYASPLAGTAAPGVPAISEGNSIAADAAGHVFVVGRTTASDFPSTTNPSDGFQLICASCQQSPPAGDAYVAAILESTSSVASVSFLPGRINFGSQPVGSLTIPPFLAGIVNTGSAPLNVSAPTISGPNFSDFALSLVAPCMNAPIPPGLPPCQFEISYTPSTVGPEQAFVTFTDDTPGGTHRLEIDAVGQGPFGVLAPQALDFDSVPVGASKPLSVTLTNVGNESLMISPDSPLQISGPNFILETNGCPPLHTITPAGSCTDSIRFAPVTTGNLKANLVILDNSGNLSDVQQLVPLSGIGTAPAPLVSIVPLQLSFGGQALGTTSAVQLVTLTNVGSTALSITNINVTGNDAGNFRLVAAGGSPCSLASGTLAVGAVCTLGVEFAPLSGGPKSAMLSFADNAAGSPQTTPVAGTGLAPVMQISPANLSFGIQTLGTPSAAQTVTLTNSGTGPLAITSVSVSGGNAGDFSESNNCPPSLGSGQNCLLHATFSPTAAGTRATAILIADNAPGNPHSIPLAGIGAVAGVSLSPTSIQFGSQPVGTSSPPVSITVTNSGAGQLDITGVSFDVSNLSDFSETNNCSQSLPPNSSCTIQVTFTPSCSTGPTARSGSLLIADNVPGAPQSILLTGTATGSFCIAPAPGGSMSATVTQGGTATFSLELVSLDGFSGSPAFTCTNQPSGAACHCPAKATLAPNETAPFVVTVATSASSRAPNDQVPPGYDVPAATQAKWPDAPLVLLLIDFLMLAGTWIIRKPQMEGAQKPIRAQESILCAAVMMVLLTVALVSCGGSGTADPGSPGTPLGTSTLKLTGTSGQTSQTALLTLTVLSH